jgi:hypothetical protein
LDKIARSRWARGLSALVAAVALVTASPAAPASAAALGDTVFNLNSGRCIGIANGLAGIFDCVHHSDQEWSVSPNCISPGWCEVWNADRRCLAVNGGNIGNGSRILGFPCSGSPDQYWAIMQDGAGLFDNFINYKAWSQGQGLWVLAVDRMRTDNGSAVILWNYNGSVDQHWASSL